MFLETAQYFYLSVEIFNNTNISLTSMTGAEHSLSHTCSMRAQTLQAATCFHRFKFVPCSDHHQVVQEARAHFLFLHLGLTASCTSAHLGSVLPVESVVPSHHSCRASGGKRRLLAVHRGSWKKNKPVMITEKKMF